MNKPEKKRLLAHIYLRDGKAVRGLKDSNLFGNGRVLALARTYEQKGADALILFDLSDTSAEQEAHLQLVREMAHKTGLPLIAGGNINRLEDVKRLLDAGCSQVFLNMSRRQNRELLEQASAVFGKERMAVCMNEFAYIPIDDRLLREHTSQVLLMGDSLHLYEAVRRMPQVCIPLVERMDFNRICALLKEENVDGISGEVISNLDEDLFRLKDQLLNEGILMEQPEASIDWSELKTNSDGLVPVVVQDYKTLEVLMVAYMNEEAYRLTIRTGRMTYWSRSRKKLWIKGETSGHFQYVKCLSIDCDNDTILAKVHQKGAACHTGNRSCFYRDILRKADPAADPMDTLRRLYQRALERKNVVNPEQVTRETAEILCHLTAVMAEHGVTWEDVTEEVNLQETLRQREDT